MKRLLILGAGGFGREIESFLPDFAGYNREWEMAGFLDLRSDVGGFPHEYPVVGDEDTFPFRPDDLLVVSVGNPELKSRIYDKLKGRVLFHTLIHNSVKIGKFVEIGEGTIICANAILTTNIRIGKCVSINVGTQIGHDCAVGDFSSLMSHVDLGGGVTLGRHVFMGTKSMVVPRKTIGDGVQVSAGSVVMRSVRASNCVLAGNPAVKLD